MAKPEVLSFAAVSTLEGNTLSGMAHVFGQAAQLDGNRYEALQAGAFDEALKTDDVRAFVEHDRRLILGRMSAGTLRLASTDEGLRYSVDLDPHVSYANDLKASVLRGDVTEMSFSFIPGEFESGRSADGLPIRAHSRVKQLIDVSFVTLPAFAGTTVELRSLQLDAGESIKSQTVRARARANK